MQTRINWRNFAYKHTAIICLLSARCPNDISRRNGPLNSSGIVRCLRRFVVGVIRWLKLSVSPLICPLKTRNILNTLRFNKHSPPLKVAGLPATSFLKMNPSFIGPCARQLLFSSWTNPASLFAFVYRIFDALPKHYHQCFLCNHLFSFTFCCHPRSPFYLFFFFGPL